MVELAAGNVQANVVQPARGTSLAGPCHFKLSPSYWENALLRDVAIRTVFMRGGTSRALFFHRNDLPAATGPDYGHWNPIFLGAMGSPDPNGRQLNGMGGGISSLSKVAVIGPPTRTDADIDYTFGQVGISDATVGFRGNCGNISSAVGPFAVDEGIVAASGDRARVRIHNTNTGKIIIAEFSLIDGKAAVHGDFALGGVAGLGDAIRLAFQAPGGATTGKLLPSGRVLDMIAVEGLGEVEVSLVDAANPTVFVQADAFGLSAREAPDALSRDTVRLGQLENLRVGAAVAMGLVRAPQEARTTLRNLPLVALVASPVDSVSLKGDSISAASVDIVTRMISSGQPHKATPLTGAMCLAVAARIPGSVVAQCARATTGDIRIGHPSGVLPVAARVHDGGAGPHHIVAEEAVIYRTARRLMEGMVYVPGEAISV